MPENPNVISTIEESRQLSVQEQVARPKTEQGAWLVNWLVQAGLNQYPWWSPARDKQLRSFWKQVDHLAGAVYTMESKISAIPFSILARDTTKKDDVAQAARITEQLQGGAEFGEGWQAFIERLVEDLITTDNGAFAEIIGYGRPDGPLVGAPVTVKTIDSSSCQRTGNPEYPIIYKDPGGKRYKIHYTRVMFRSQMTSTIAEMFGVGFCAVSRAINIGQTLFDILQFKQEKLGSRPHRGIIVTQGGLDPEDVAGAFRIVEGTLDSQGLTRSSRFAVVGSSSLPEADLLIKDLASLPDGFNEETSLVLGMASIALAFGLDARELFPAMTSGATRADALLMHLKQRGKGPGQIIQTIEQLFNYKFLPPHLKMEFDYQDDEQDRQAAEVKEIRSRRWRQALDSGTMDVRTAREQMVEVGDLERGQFERMELEEGRLPDGTSVLALFYSKDKTIQKYLKLGDTQAEEIDPFDTDSNEPAYILPLIREKVGVVQEVIINSKSETERFKAQQALAALTQLEKQYKTPEPPEQEPEPEAEEDDGLVHPDSRGTTRRRDNLAPSRATIQVNDEENLEPDSDDRL